MKSKVNKYTQEVEQKLKAIALKNDNAKAEKLQKYLGTKFDVLNIATKHQVDICKQGYDFYTDDKTATFLKLNSVLKESNIFEGKNQAYIYLDKNFKHIPENILFKTLPTWVKHVDNWAHSDTLSKFLTRFLENESTYNNFISIIEKWNSSKKMWERRQSIVSLYYYSRTKKQHIDFDYGIALIDNLLLDNEYFVQKAVGWALRESYNVYPKQTFNYIEQNIKLIPSAAYTACTEKLSLKEKDYLKQLRK